MEPLELAPILCVFSIPTMNKIFAQPAKEKTGSIIPYNMSIAYFQIFNLFFHVAHGQIIKRGHSACRYPDSNGAV